MVFMEDKFKKIIKGTAAEIISAVASYPLSTLKANKQTGIVFKGGLYRGIKWCVLNELINGLFFYSTYHFTNGNVLLKTGCATIVSKSISHPVFLRRKLIQVGLSATIKGTGNYKGFGMSLINAVPVNIVNFGLKDRITETVPDNFKAFSGLLSTFLAIIITHPLDTLNTSVMCKTPMVGLFSGFKERVFERTVTIGSKMVLLDVL